MNKDEGIEKAQAIIDAERQKRVDELNEQLIKLTPRPFSGLISAVISTLLIAAITYYFMSNVLPTEENFIFIAIYVILIAGGSSADSYRTRKRVDLLTKLVQTKLT